MTPESATTDRVSIRLGDSPDDMRVLLSVAESVWGPPAGAMVSPDFLMALAQTGGYVALAEIATSNGSVPVGASFGFLARHDRELTLHSHITGVLPEYHHLGIGFLLKQHQRSWAMAHDLEVITWTFDPLVRRNGWFNLHRLGATAEEYFINFYGPLGDTINGSDETDRLLARWDVNSDRAIAAAQRTLPSVVPGDADRVVSLPHDIITMRRNEPASALSWRLKVRQDLGRALTDHRILAMTADGDYVLTPRSVLTSRSPTTAQ